MNEDIKPINPINSADKKCSIILVKRGYSYIEVPTFVKPTAKSSALTLKNIFGVIGTIARLSYEVNIKREI